MRQRWPSKLWGKGHPAHPLVIRSKGRATARPLFVGENLSCMCTYNIGEDHFIEAIACDRVQIGYLLLKSKKVICSSPVTKEDAERFEVIGEFDSYISLMVCLRDLDRKARSLKPKTPEYIDPIDSIRIADVLERPRSFRQGLVPRRRSRQFIRWIRNAHLQEDRQEEATQDP